MSKPALIGIILLNVLVVCAIAVRRGIQNAPERPPRDSSEWPVRQLPERPESGRPETASDNPQVKALRLASFDLAEETLATIPDSSEVLNLLGTLHLRSNSEPSAKTIWQGITDEFPNSAEAWLNLAHLAIKQGEFDEACQHFARAEKISPSMLEIYSPFADAAFQAGQSEKAIEILQKKKAISELAPDDWCVMGRAYSDLTDLGGATESFEKALAIDANSREALNGLSQAYRRAGDADNAKRVAKQLADVNAQMGRVDASRDVQGRDVKLAEQIYELAVSQCVNAALTHHQEAEALKIAKAGRIQAPNSRVILLTCVSVLLQSRQYDDAMRQFVRYTNNNPDDSTAWMRFAETALQLRRFEPAELAARRAMELQPTAAAPLRILCQVMIASGGNTSEAVSVAEKAYQLDASAAGAYLLGTAQFHANNLVAARKSLQTAINLAPSNTEYRRALANLSGK